ncbi:hypothetical protein EMCRGX_G010082 [Ephydatia muelleri]
MTNAFNLVSRQAVLDECAQHFPELLAWMLWMVTTIHTDEECAELLNDVWYLDDGSMAGESSSVFRALIIIQAQGPSLGIYINLNKCELFGVGDLSLFPLSIQTSKLPNIEHPLVMLNFANNSSLINIRQPSLTINDLGSIDPQVSLVLLRICSSFCKLAHIASATPPHLILGSLEKFDTDVRHSFAECTGVDVPDSAWRQAQLSLRRGGFDLRSLALHSPHM